MNFYITDWPKGSQMSPSYKLMKIIQHWRWCKNSVCVCVYICSCVSVFAVMEVRDKRAVPDKRTEQTSGRWHMWFTLADWWKHGLFNTPHLSLLHISPSALCQSQQCTLVIFSCLEWIIVFVCFERCGGKASSVYSLCILPWFADPNALNLKRMTSLHEDTTNCKELGAKFTCASIQSAFQTPRSLLIQ